MKVCVGFLTHLYHGTYLLLLNRMVTRMPWCDSPAVHTGWQQYVKSMPSHQYIHLAWVDADPILGEFFVKYGHLTFRIEASITIFRFQGQAASMRVAGDALYSALLTDAENEPSNWDLQGRQADAWIKYSSSCPPLHISRLIFNVSRLHSIRRC
jgi:hypothetical protein